MNKIYVWSIFTRLSHIFLIAAVSVAYLIADFENLLSYHAALGYVVGLLFLFRILWGYMDVKFSKFEDFNFNLKDLAEYMLNIFGNKKEYVGHSPVSSWAIVAMIALGLASVVSGVIVYGTQEGIGLLSFLNISLFKEMDFFEDLHEFFVNAFMFVVFVHIAGVIIDIVLHKSQALDSIVDGYKSANSDGLKLTILQKVFGIAWVGSSLVFLLYLLASPSNILLADASNPTDKKVEHSLFERESISCYTFYPPHLLPMEPLVNIMDNLEKYFEYDASHDKKEKNSIKDYPVENSAES
ncbi:cytochrome b/b6 domain-containing protein [Sulfurimonas sp.]|uniref:cytochrome b/b6 domain-containing protein n=1 Tax=Sulfurimonas sp. TaxID=2022749 RepID=UPI0025D1CEC0|nr:cytochrome b/b6 domain-containing protein [Sulfurimonas sp.]MBW6488933.1 cytochrome b/b6 domain-containing protein [Sulfurimonas sp.]